MSSDKKDNNSSSGKGKEKKGSSLKNCNFNNLTAEEIIKKYEDVLESRENQLTELSDEMGKVGNKIQNLKTKFEKSELNNKTLKIILTKKEALLKQELNNKEIMFMQLTKKEQEYDELQNKIKELREKKKEEMNGGNKGTDDGKDKGKSGGVDNKNDKNKKENSDNKKEDKKEKDVSGKTTEDEDTPSKSSAREKINQLKNQNENMKKINFAELLKKKNENK